MTLIEGEGDAHVDLHELALPPRPDGRRFGRSYPHVPAVERRDRTRTAYGVLDRGGDAMSVHALREAAPFRLLHPHLAMGRGCPREEWTD